MGNGFGCLPGACATFRRHSRRQEHDNVCSKISKMCGKKEGAGKRFPKPHGFISDGAREVHCVCKQLRRPGKCLKSQRSGIVFPKALEKWSVR